MYLLQPEAVIDMKQRYIGHCNVGTDIKQASFLGQRGMSLCVTVSNFSSMICINMCVYIYTGKFIPRLAFDKLI